MVEFVKVLQLDDKNIRAMLEIAVIHKRQGNEELIEKIYLDVLKINKNSSSANEFIGLKKLKARELDQAKNHLTRAISSDSRQWKSHNALGVIADLEKNYMASIHHYSEALSVKPNNPMLLNNLGYSHYLSGNEDAAKKYFNQALSFNDKFQRAIFNLALIEIKNRHYSSALTLFNRVMESHESFNNIGYVCMLDGQYDSAELYFKKAINESPYYFPKAQENLKSLQSIRYKTVSYQPNKTKPAKKKSKKIAKKKVLHKPVIAKPEIKKVAKAKKQAVQTAAPKAPKSDIKPVVNTVNKKIQQVKKKELPTVKPLGYIPLKHSKKDDTKITPKEKTATNISNPLKETDTTIPLIPTIKPLEISPAASIAPYSETDAKNNNINQSDEKLTSKEKPENEINNIIKEKNVTEPLIPQFKPIEPSTSVVNDQNIKTEDSNKQVKSETTPIKITDPEPVQTEITNTVKNKDTKTESDSPDSLVSKDKKQLNENTPVNDLNQLQIVPASETPEKQPIPVITFSSELKPDINQQVEKIPLKIVNKTNDSGKTTDIQTDKNQLKQSTAEILKSIKHEIDTSSKSPLLLLDPNKKDSSKNSLIKDIPASSLPLNKVEEPVNKIQ